MTLSSLGRSATRFILGGGLALLATLASPWVGDAAQPSAKPQASPDAGRRYVVAHPDDPSKHVEYFEARPGGSGPWPTIVLLHGQQDAPSEGARVFVEMGMLSAFARRGMLAVGVSLPGYGGSSGPDDFAGPFAVHGVEGVIRAIQDSGLVRRDDVVVEGVSLGAMTAGMLAADDPQLAGAVLISGEYDMPAVLTHPRTMKAWLLIARAALHHGGRTGLRSRSVLSVASRIKQPLLVVNGETDDRTDPLHARHLVAAIDSAGGRARFVLVPGYGHQIPPKVRGSIVDPFLATIFGTSTR